MRTGHRPEPPTDPTVQIEAFLAKLKPEMRGALEELRATIRAAAPDAVEAISYGTAAFRYRNRPLVSYGAAKTHAAFYVMSPAALDAHRDRLAGYETSKGTIRFPATERLPTDLVTSIVRARMAETDVAADR